MKKVAAILLVIGGMLSGCVVYDVPHRGDGQGADRHSDRSGDSRHDRDRDERDRSGDRDDRR